MNSTLWKRSILAAALAVSVFAGAACISGTLVTSSHEIASFTGRVVSGPATNSEFPFECTWLEAVSGRRLEVMYPPGWDERFSPTRILDAAGAVFAREGDFLRVTYIADGIGESACLPGIPVAAETVERIAPPGTKGR